MKHSQNQFERAFISTVLVLMLLGLAPVCARADVGNGCVDIYWNGIWIGQDCSEADSDDDGVPNKDDNDDDGDGYSDEEEAALGTDPMDPCDLGAFPCPGNTQGPSSEPLSPEEVECMLDQLQNESKELKPEQEIPSREEPTPPSPYDPLA